MYTRLALLLTSSTTIRGWFIEISFETVAVNRNDSTECESLKLLQDEMAVLSEKNCGEFWK